MNNSPSNIFYTLLLLERFHQNSQANSAATGMNRLIVSEKINSQLNYPAV